MRQTECYWLQWFAATLECSDGRGNSTDDVAARTFRCKYCNFGIALSRAASLLLLLLHTSCPVNIERWVVYRRRSYMALAALLLALHYNGAYGQISYGTDYSSRSIHWSYADNASKPMGLRSYDIRWLYICAYSLQTSRLHCVLQSYDTTTLYLANILTHKDYTYNYRSVIFAYFRGVIFRFD